ESIYFKLRNNLNRNKLELENFMENQINITHTFDAPRELVFKAFTEAEHLKHWWGPKGWTFEVAEAEFRPGGIFHYSQKPDNGDIMWVKFVRSEERRVGKGGRYRG